MQNLCFQTFSLQPLFLTFVVFHGKSKLIRELVVCGLKTHGWRDLDSELVTTGWVGGWVDG